MGGGPGRASRAAGAWTAAWALLAKADRSSLNVEGAYQHILADLYGFIGTVVAAILMPGIGRQRQPVATDALAVDQQFPPLPVDVAQAKSRYLSGARAQPQHQRHRGGVPPPAPRRPDHRAPTTPSAENDSTTGASTNIAAEAGGAAARTAFRRARAMVERQQPVIGGGIGESWAGALLAAFTISWPPTANTAALPRCRGVLAAMRAVHAVTVHEIVTSDTAAPSPPITSNTPHRGRLPHRRAVQHPPESPP